MKRFICMILFLFAAVFADEQGDTVYGASIYADQLFPFSRPVNLPLNYSPQASNIRGPRHVVRPPLNTGRIALESVAGFGAGIGTAIAGAFIGNMIAPYDCYGYPLCISPGAFFGILIGYPLGTALGVYAVGNIGIETGSFSSTLTGSIAGILIGIYVAGKVDSEISFFVTSVAGPVIAFNMSRRYKNRYYVGSDTGTYRHRRVWDHQTPLIPDGGVGVNVLSIGF
jgi:hypothetical protein